MDQLSPVNIQGVRKMFEISLDGSEPAQETAGELPHPETLRTEDPPAEHK